MNSSSEKDIADYRIAEASEAIDDVELLLRHKRYRAAANRIYYAAFYAASAALLTKSLQFAKHSAVISFFDKEFVKTGIFPKEYSKSLHLAFHERQEDDYMPFVEFDENELIELFAGVKKMVRGIKDFLEEE